MTGEPDLYILDEPTAELDPMGTDDVFAVLDKLNRELGLTVIIIEHKLEHLSKYCQRLLIVDQGKILIDGAPGDIFKQWRQIKNMGVKPPQVTEFFGRLQEYRQESSDIPVTLEEAKSMLNSILAADEDD
jgi:energy-coupling factor transporter ATP-binding protein EcfA2